MHAQPATRSSATNSSLGAIVRSSALLLGRGAWRWASALLARAGAMDRHDPVCLCDPRRGCGTRGRYAGPCSVGQQLVLGLALFHTPSSSRMGDSTVLSMSRNARSIVPGDLYWQWLTFNAAPAGRRIRQRHCGWWRLAHLLCHSRSVGAVETGTSRSALQPPMLHHCAATAPRLAFIYCGSLAVMLPCSRLFVCADRVGAAFRPSSVP